MATPHARHHRSIDGWPDPDRRLWEAAEASGITTRIPLTKLRRIAGGYGLWLNALAA